MAGVQTSISTIQDDTRAAKEAVNGISSDSSHVRERVDTLMGDTSKIKDDIAFILGTTSAMAKDTELNRRNLEKILLALSMYGGVQERKAQRPRRHPVMGNFFEGVGGYTEGALDESRPNWREDLTFSEINTDIRYLIKRLDSGRDLVFKRRKELLEATWRPVRATWPSSPPLNIFNLARTGPYKHNRRYTHFKPFHQEGTWWRIRHVLDKDYDKRSMSPQKSEWRKHIGHYVYHEDYDEDPIDFLLSGGPVTRHRPFWRYTPSDLFMNINDESFECVSTTTPYPDRGPQVLG